MSYILKIDHSLECYGKNSKKSVNTFKTIKDYDDFKSKCYDLMNKSSSEKYIMIIIIIFLCKKINQII